MKLRKTQKRLATRLAHYDRVMSRQRADNGKVVRYIRPGSNTR